MALLTRKPCLARPVCSQARARVPARVLVTPVRAVAKADLPPSSRTAANELEALQSLSTIVPDLLAAQVTSGTKPAAATVSFGMLSSVLAAQKLGQGPIKNAIVNAINFDGCASLKGAARLECCVDKAIANVAALLAGQVAAGGRVAVNVDVRLANDTDGLVKKVHAMNKLCSDMGLTPNRLVWRLPATWAAIQAAKRLEQEGHATQVYFVFSLAQGVAAMQAGVSVLQTSVGTTREWYDKNPGAIRDPKGPRQDSGCGSGVDTGVRLASDLYNYARKYHPKTKIMASGLRSREDALALAGIDYLVLPGRVVSSLESTPTAQGYNDGLNAGAGDAGLTAALSPAAAAKADIAKMAAMDEGLYKASLGDAAQQLTDAGLKSQRADVEALLAAMRTMATGME